MPSQLLLFLLLLFAAGEPLYANSFLEHAEHTSTLAQENPDGWKEFFPTILPDDEESENMTIIEPVRCDTDEDCLEYQTVPGTKVICDATIRTCIIGLLEEKPVTVFPKVPTTSTTWQSIFTTTENVTTPPPLQLPNEFENIPVIVWVLFTIPFISIIVLGIICGRRLKSQSENIQENLLRTTINGVHVDQLLSQRDIISSIAFSRPPPTYEKATGEVPPGYETVLQGLGEKRLSIFQCDSLMNEQDKEQGANSETLSYSSNSGSLRSLRSLPQHHRAGRGTPILFTISHNNLH